MAKKKESRKVAIEAVRTNRKRLLTNESPFAIKEAYVKLRTSLMFCMTADKERPCTSFAVTSAKPSEGKSLTAANIAISYAMLGKKVLLIDADMRKPTQRRLWRVEKPTGLCDFLAKISKLELDKVKDLPLWIVCTGTIPPNPSELLSSERMKHFVEESAKVYDYIIIDTPPINTVADAQIVSTYVDGVVLVVKSGDTTEDELNEAIDAVRRAGGNLCGTVLNDLNMKSVKYAYKYKLSTDKAAYPINAMGMTKAVMEKDVIARSRQMLPGDPILCLTRYGNVMGSRGSVIPLFCEQIDEGKQLTITNPEMTRFMMTLNDAVDLVLYAFEHGQQGDLFVQKAPAATIETLAQAILELKHANVDVTTIGTRHGEKLYEVLVTSEEMLRAEDLPGFFRIHADNRDLNYDNYFSKGTKGLEAMKQYTSHNTQRLDVAGMKQLLLKLKLFGGRY